MIISQKKISLLKHLASSLPIWIDKYETKFNLNTIRKYLHDEIYISTQS